MRACIDIGGTKVAASLATGNGRELIARQVESTVTTGDDGALARQVLRLVEQACLAAGVPTSAVQEAAIASCGPFVRLDGQLALAAPNLCGGLAGPARGLPNDWAAIPLQAPLAARFPAGLHIANDCVAAVLAERRWGALAGMDHCAYVTWSTGIGTGLVVDGRPLLGKHGNAGHAGHMFTTDEPEGLCGCGNVGDVEGLVAGNAIVRRFGRDAADLMAAAEAGDTGALAQVDAVCRTLGRMLYNLVVSLDLQGIALGGSVFWHHQGLLLPRLQAQVTGRMPALSDGCVLVPAGLGERLGDYAALALLDAGP